MNADCTLCEGDEPVEDEDEKPVLAKKKVVKMGAKKKVVKISAKKKA